MFLGAAALPFFANTDETAHFDVVVKYARNLVPVKEWDQYDIASAGMIVTHDSPHFFIPLDRLPSDQTPVPLWTLPAHVRQGYIGQWLQSARKNHEAYSPPVYYAIAASWYTLGATLGLQNGTLLYWSRFLNIPLFVGLVLAAHTFCVRIYPTRPWLRWSVPLLVAFFPQDVFYTINSDVLSPLAFLTAFFLLLSWDRRTIEDARLGLGAGVAVAATMLVKYSNVAIVLVLAVVLAQALPAAIVSGMPRRVRWRRTAPSRLVHLLPRGIRRLDGYGSKNGASRLVDSSHIPVDRSRRIFAKRPWVFPCGACKALLARRGGLALANDCQRGCGPFLRGSKRNAPRRGGGARMA
jgi:hypothetical protein